jgi:hypothetical protein
MATTNPKMTQTLAQRRDPANELYDRACDVIAVAAALREASAQGNTEAATAATLGCLEAALQDIAVTIEQLHEASVRRLRRAWPVLGEQASADADDACNQFSAATTTIRAASSALSEARQTIGPLLAELTAL